MIQPLHLNDDRPSFAFSALILGEKIYGINFKCGSVLLIDESIILTYEVFNKKQNKQQQQQLHFTLSSSGLPCHEKAPDVSEH